MLALRDTECIGNTVPPSVPSSTSLLLGLASSLATLFLAYPGEEEFGDLDGRRFVHCWIWLYHLAFNDASDGATVYSEYE
ncbi:hypothetical protein NCC49_004451 [Naganishia albida]|nr:hypothetical protein NCC49_004451 [Naganishia albida]